MPFNIQTMDGTAVQRSPRQVDWTPLMAEKGGYKHFMLKEIHEQPRALADTLTGRIPSNHQDAKLDSINVFRCRLEAVPPHHLVACGTSYHAGLVGKFLMEGLARIPVEVDLASEFRYRQSDCLQG